jgi:hypothetical protein
MPIVNAIGALQLSEDYGFTDLPMPYDINILARTLALRMSNTLSPHNHIEPN